MKLQYNELPSNVGFEYDLRRYTEAQLSAEAARAEALAAELAASQALTAEARATQQVTDQRLKAGLC